MRREEKQGTCLSFLACKWPDSPAPVISGVLRGACSKSGGRKGFTKCRVPPVGPLLILPHLPVQPNSDHIAPQLQLHPRTPTPWFPTTLGPCWSRPAHPCSLACRLATSCHPTSGFGLHVPTPGPLRMQLRLLKCPFPDPVKAFGHRHKGHLPEDTWKRLPESTPLPSPSSPHVTLLFFLPSALT